MLIMRGNELVLLMLVLLDKEDVRRDNRCIIDLLKTPLLPRLLLFPLGPFELAVAPPRERCIFIIMGFASYASTAGRESARDHDLCRTDNDEVPPLGPPCRPHEYAGN
jgi:hypothetical protein